MTEAKAFETFDTLQTPPAARLAPLGAHFYKLWLALTASLFGSEITKLAVPLTAVLILNANETENGLLSAAGQLPFLLFSLFIGVWVDRLPHRPLIIVADLARAGALLVIPVLAVMNQLQLGHLYAVAFVVGAFSAMFEIAHYAYVPTMIDRETLVHANSRIQISYSAADAAGPGLGGLLIRVLSAPFAIVFDVASYLISAVLLLQMGNQGNVKTQPEAPTAQPTNLSLWSGMSLLFGDAVLRSIIIASMISGLFYSGFTALYILYATRDLGLNPAAIGLIFAAGGTASVLSTMIAQPLAARFGTGRTIIVGWLLSYIGLLFVPLTAQVEASSLWVVVMLIAAQAIYGLSEAIANIHQWSLRQAMTPPHLHGRVTAAHRFLVYGTMAIGAALGGWISQRIGLSTALLVFVVGALLGPVWAIFTPLWRLQRPPETGIST
jgi:MFS family permease